MKNNVETNVKNKIKHAFLLAAGYGNRMETYTKEVPKPLLKVGGVPLIVYSLYTLKKLGIENVVVNTHYLADQIENFLKSTSKELPFNISISHESEILGTAGALKKAIVEKRVPEDQNFFLLNTDVILQPPSGIDKEMDDELFPVSKANLPPETLSCLYLKEKDQTNKEKGWNLNQKKQLHLNTKHGQFYYIGFSIVNPLLLSALPPNQTSELGPLWADASKKNRLMGEPYRSSVILCGNKIQYENIKNTIPEFLQNDSDFLDFCEWL